MVEPDALAAVRPYWVNLLDFFCFGIQFYLLLSPYLCFISFSYPDIYVLGDGALISWGSYMQTKHQHLCVLIHIRINGRFGAPWNGCKPSSKIFLLAVPRRYFFCGSFMLFLSCFCYAFVRVNLSMPCGHLLGKGWTLGSLLWCLIVKLSLSHWYRGAWLCRFLIFAVFFTFLS